jgi:hypothetical protein
MKRALNRRNLLEPASSLSGRCTIHGRQPDDGSQVYSDGQVAGDAAMTVENLINAIKSGEGRRPGQWTPYR